MAKAGELNNITFQSLGPIATAAENHRLIVAQAEKDEAWRATRDKEKEKEKEKDKDKVEGEKPYMVNAGGVVDDFLNEWCSPLHTFLDTFSSPHKALAPFILLHLGFWYYSPWYLHFLLPYGMIYLVPVWGSLVAVYKKDQRRDWMSYWVILASLEYFELLVFQGTARSLIWWPKLKAVFCIALYCTVDRKETRNARKEKLTLKTSGAVKLIEPFLPDPPKPEKKDKDDKGKEKDKDKKDDKKDPRGSDPRKK